MIFRLGGNEALDGIFVCVTRSHWHFVTAGLSDLWGDGRVLFPIYPGKPSGSVDFFICSIQIIFYLYLDYCAHILNSKFCLKIILSLKHQGIFVLQKSEEFKSSTWNCIHMYSIWNSFGIFLGLTVTRDSKFVFIG